MAGSPSSKPSRLRDGLGNSNQKKVGQFKGHPGRSHAFGINFAGLDSPFGPDGALPHTTASQTRRYSIDHPDAIGYLALSSTNCMADTGSNYRDFHA